MSRSETPIKRNKGKPSQPLMMCGLLNSRVRHQEVSPMVLVQKKKRFWEKETKRWWKKKKREKEIQQLWKEGLAGWLRGKSRKEEVFSSSLSLFSRLSILFYFHLATSITLSPLLLLSLRDCSLRQELSWQGCLFLMFDISPCAARLKEHTRMNAPRFSKEHLVISQRFPHSNTLGTQINTRSTNASAYTHTYMHRESCAHECKGAFKNGKIYQAF